MSTFIPPAPDIADATDAEVAAMTYPICVYGTLRPGYGNSRLWRDRARDLHDGDVTVTGYRLVGRGFPYAIASEGESIAACLIVPEPWTYDAVLADMDMLEGVPDHYTRELIVADTPDGFRVAWMYVCAFNPDHMGQRFAVPTDEKGRYDWALIGR